jgi:hypothetical protein
MANPLDLFDQRLRAGARRQFDLHQRHLAQRQRGGTPTPIARNIAQHFVMEHHFISAVATQTRQGSFGERAHPKNNASNSLFPTTELK